MLKRLFARHMLVLATVMLALVLMSCAARGQSSSTPSATGTIPVGVSTLTITVGGRSRTFHLYRPATLSDPAPLVVMLHGGFGSGSQAEKSYHWDDEANSGHFLVAYPDGVNRAWNTGGGCCGTPASQHIDDVGFLTQMVATIEHEVPINASRIYVTGISNGGIM